MANSRVGNYQLEFDVVGFSNPNRTHTHAIYVAPTSAPATGADPANVDIQLKGGGTDSLQNVANEYHSYFKRLYAVGIAVESFTLWRYITENSKDFVCAGVASSTQTGTGVTQEAGQLTMTMRTAGGSILKLVYLETNFAGKDSIALTTNPLGTRADIIAQYALSARGAIIGIDNTFPVAPLKRSLAENDKVFNKIYRA